MAAVAPPADQTADLLKNLSLDSQTKTLEISEPVKKPSVDAGNGQGQPINRSITPMIPDFMDPAVAYYPNAYASTAYYYGGYDGTTNDWDDYSRYMSPDGVDMYGYGYAPYGPYSPAGSPVPTVGNDGQFYGAQHYQYPSPYFQPMAPTGGPYPSAAAPHKGEITTSAGADQAPLTVDMDNGNSNSKVNGAGAKGNTGSEPVMSTTYQISALNGNGFDGVYYPMSWLDGSLYFDWQPRNNANTASLSNGNGVSSRNNLMSSRPMSGLNTPSGYMNRMYSNKLYGGYGNGYRPGYGFGSNAYYSQNNGRGWLAVDNKYKPRGRGNGFYGYSNENVDGLNELNRGPRAKITKNQKVLTSINVDVKGQNITLTTTECIEKASLTPDREQYNLTEFPVTYNDAKFFIIKSYSEDDVHKSIKYNVWASTPNGNKKLDAAYQEAQQKPQRCPVFLFFSVNTSGQFVGVAEMVGPVDFDKSLEYWQQDKWIGCFPVKWHIVKDVPNSLLKHITLEYNENKPVTNSRDTQEVKLEQGLQVIKIFKEHSSKQCILDDFEFYEERQRRILEKKAKQQQFQKQVWAIDEKSKEDSKVEVIPPKSAEVLKDLVNEANPEVMENVQKDPAAKIVGDVAKPAEKTVLLNGLANGC